MNHRGKARGIPEKKYDKNRMANNIICLENLENRYRFDEDVNINKEMLSPSLCFEILNMINMNSYEIILFWSYHLMDQNLTIKPELGKTTNVRFLISLKLLAVNTVPFMFSRHVRNISIIIHTISQFIWCQGSNFFSIINFGNNYSN